MLVHGIIFFELKRFAESLGQGVWWSVMREARLEGRLYLPLRVYPDADLQALIKATARLRRLKEHQMLEAFGAFLAPRLLEFYRVLAEPSWRTLEVIEHADARFYASVSRTAPEVSCPFRVRRIHEEELEVTYFSQRRLCSMARGMILGLAAHFGETVNLREVECMHAGAGQCRIIVTRTSLSRPEPAPPHP